ncbi:damage-inducible protein [Mesorhizobium sp. M1217]|uniref:ImuA family protein n=1 Tax=Mesorhizobium sp. M1217 TaxID=2957070 RepID=UPI0033389019
MSVSAPPAAISELRERIARLEGGNARARTVLPFGVIAIDRVLPGGGLALGGLHEVAGGGNGAVDGAAAALFAAGIAARTVGKVLWCVTRPDLFAPAIEQAGLPPGRVIYVEAGDEKSVLACFEEGLRGGFGAVVAEIARLSMTASRRLQLAAESSGAIGIAIRRWRRQTEATDFGQPTAAETRWRVSVLPSTSRTGSAVPTRIASMRLSTRKNRRSSRPVPSPRVPVACFSRRPCSARAAASSGKGRWCISSRTS